MNDQPSPSAYAAELIATARAKASGKTDPAQTGQSSNASASNTTQPTEKTGDVSGNNGGDKGGAGGSGGGGSGGGAGAHQPPKPSSWTYLKVQTAVIAHCTLAVSVMMAYLLVSRMSDKGIELQKEELRTETSKEQTKQMNAMARIVEAGGQVDQPSMNTSTTRQTSSQSKTVVSGQDFAFNCISANIDEIFRSKVAFHLDSANQTLIPTSGCLVVIFDGRINNLKGEGYLITWANKRMPGHRLDCGKQDDYNDSDAKCLADINRNLGSPMYISVRNDGHLTIN